jgi:hypothetical protein
VEWLKVKVLSSNPNTTTERERTQDTLFILGFADISAKNFIWFSKNMGLILRRLETPTEGRSPSVQKYSNGPEIMAGLLFLRKCVLKSRKVE